VAKRKTSKSEPQTMADLLSESGYQIKGIKRGQQFEGTVSVILRGTVYVDIGAKCEGLVTNREFEAAKDFIKSLKAGDKVLVSVVSPEDNNGQLLLSLKKAAYTSAWKKFLEAKEKDEEVEVLVKEETPSGLLIEVQGLTGFIPYSQIGKETLKKVKELAGKTLRVKVLEVEQGSNRLVFSEKAVSEKEEIAKLKKILQKIEIGAVVEGEVVAVFPFGVFVKVEFDAEEIDGLIHISEISWEKVENPQGLFKVGDRVKVKIIGKDEESVRLSFSIKQTTSDPWQEKIKKYAPESFVSGKIIRLVSYGAVVELEEGVEGFLHISRIPPETKIEVGEKIDCFVEKIEAEKRRITLGLVLKEKPIGYK